MYKFLHKIFYCSLCIIITAGGCGIKSHKQGKSLAMRMNDTAMLGYFKNHKTEEAMQILNKAIAIDSHCYAAWQNKCDFQLSLHQLDSALLSAKKIASFSHSHVEDELIGIIYHKLDNKDSSTVYFKTSLQYYDMLLDTMNKKNIFYKQSILNRGIALVLVDRNDEADSVFMNLYKESEKDEMIRHFCVQYVDKSKKEVIDELYSSQAANSFTYYPE